MSSFYNYNVLSFFSKLFRSPLDRADSGDVKSELVLLALPAVVGQALDPLAQLLETAYIGRLGNSLVL